MWFAKIKWAVSIAYHFLVVSLQDSSILVTVHASSKDTCARNSNVGVDIITYALMLCATEWFISSAESKYWVSMNAWF